LGIVDGSLLEDFLIWFCCEASVQGLWALLKVFVRLWENKTIDFCICTAAGASSFKSHEHSLALN